MVTKLIDTKYPFDTKFKGRLNDLFNQKCHQPGN